MAPSAIFATETGSDLDRIWAPRENQSTYDAAYVALTEVRDGTLLTGAARLACAPGSYGCARSLLREGNAPRDTGRDEDAAHSTFKDSEARRGPPPTLTLPGDRRTL